MKRLIGVFGAALAAFEKIFTSTSPEVAERTRKMLSE